MRKNACKDNDFSPIYQQQPLFLIRLPVEISPFGELLLHLQILNFKNRNERS